MNVLYSQFALSKWLDLLASESFDDPRACQFTSAERESGSGVAKLSDESQG